MKLAAAGLTLWRGLFMAAGGLMVRTARGGFAGKTQLSSDDSAHEWTRGRLLLDIAASLTRR
jgi:hypothetical protein